MIRAFILKLEVGNEEDPTNVASEIQYDLIGIGYECEVTPWESHSPDSSFPTPSFPTFPAL